MIDERALFERTFDRFPPPDRSFDRLLTRRDRKRRNERLAAGAVALLLAIAAIGGAVSVFRSAERERPGAPSITPENVGSLGLAWSATLDGKVGVWFCGDLCSTSAETSPVGRGIVAISTGNTLYAFPISCSTAATCDPLWTADVPGSHVVVADDVVYASSANTLYAFDASCGAGGETCEPLWTGATAPKLWGLAVLPSVVYVETGGRMYGFPTSCASTGGTCDPISVRPRRPPVPDGRLTYVTARDGRSLVAYPTACLDTPDACPAAWTWAPPPGERVSGVVAGSGSVVAWVAPYPWHRFTPTDAYLFSSTCESDVSSCSPVRLVQEQAIPFGSYPSGGSLISNGRFFWRMGFADPRHVPTYSVYSTTCAATGSCEPLFQVTVGGFNWATSLTRDPRSGLVFAVEKYGRIAALPTSCSSPPCRPTWVSQPLGDWTGDVATADGVVFVGSSYNGRVEAYAEDCGTGGSTCRPLWSSPTPIAQFRVADGALFATSGNRLMAFEPGAKGTIAGTNAPWGFGLWWVVPAVLIAIAAITLVRRRRRRASGRGPRPSA